jgi:hypothetical protein
MVGCMRAFALLLTVVIAGCSSGSKGGMAAPTGGTTGTPTGGTATGGSTSSGGSTGGNTADAATDGSAPDVAIDAGPTGECAAMFGAGVASQWVFYGPDGRLQYKALDPQGDRIMDFSQAGYRGGGVALPRVPMAAMVSPSGSDDTAAIQAAIDLVSAGAPAGGLRGAVVLAAGNFNLLGTLTITASGVVLRGAGSGAGGTTVALTGDPHLFLKIAGAGTWADDDAAQALTDDYLPAGSRSFTVADGSAFKVGDPVLVRRPVTDAWIHFMGMDTLVRNGLPQTWLSNTTRIPADRVITAVEGNRLTVDVPLPDSYDARYLRPPGATVSKYTFPGRIEQVGVEHLRVTAPPLVAAITAPLFNLLRVSAAQDGWLDDVVAEETEVSVALDANVKRFTLRDLVIRRSTVADSSAGYPLEVTLSGSQLLMVGGSMKGDNLYTYTTVSRVTGPNVALQASATGAHTRLEPHERWAVGFLADNVTHDDALDLVNRGTAGSGHGWAIGWGVLWNSSAASLNVEQPPGSMNWAIGGKGKTAGTGTFEAIGMEVAPKSLYLAQLCERLGPAAVAAVRN